MKTLKNLKLIFATLLTLTFIACSNESNTQNDIDSGTQDPARITVKLQDMPGDYDNVFVEVIDVMVKYDSDQGEDGWQSLEAINTGVYDLLELTGGVNVLLADDYEIPAGELKQIRLILGEDNSIVVNGETLPLRTPSAQQSGLKIQINELLEPNIGYTFLLDFDVDESIIMAGNSGNINLKPKLRASVEASSGVIVGSILPVDVQTEITASNDADSISSFANDDGIFMLVGLPEGVYTVTVTPDPDSGLEVQVIENVEVTSGNTTDLGEITLD
ncbi:MAG: DUF4382 domain-containing protein [Bacteroidia bacterium]|nr:DUF4382 domain-containing protein [Bacteroidia bacterium]NND10784.1 DUF4382 domain-containing protein [Flavobacteriaceae bacterium]MBT8308905.1 DUF4382 domain-containing protein [Bacteroidia bacterium]NNK26828.1 DUF4382 domain-containing protein [Flavobacteriaceae bacterium]NNL60149.1 DUF4382 domain-containing protein [Flavobacteriaceae bacterium]